MTTDGQTSSTPSGSKRPKSRKNRVQTVEKNGLAKLPSLLSKSNSFLSQSGKWLMKIPCFFRIISIETTYFKKYRPQQKDVLNTSSSKIERQTTNINPQSRLPPLNTTINDQNNKQRSDFQRRQVWLILKILFYSISYSIDLCIKSSNAWIRTRTVSTIL